MTWMMPWEGDPHDRLWLAWPVGGYALGDSDETALAAQRTWAAVANAAADFEPVTVVVDPADLDAARTHLSAVAIELREAPLDDAWMRDMGPTFVLDRDAEDGPKLGAVDWIFNGWGAPDWAVWEQGRADRASVARLVAEASGIASSHRQRGRRHPRRRSGHGAADRDGPARPGAQPPR